MKINRSLPHNPEGSAAPQIPSGRELIAAAYDRGCSAGFLRDKHSRMRGSDGLNHPAADFAVARQLAGELSKQTESPKRVAILDRISTLRGIPEDVQGQLLVHALGAKHRQEQSAAIGCLLTASDPLAAIVAYSGTFSPNGEMRVGALRCLAAIDVPLALERSLTILENRHAKPAESAAAKALLRRYAVLVGSDEMASLKVLREAFEASLTEGFLSSVIRDGIAARVQGKSSTYVLAAQMAQVVGCIDATPEVRIAALQDINAYYPEIGRIVSVAALKTEPTSVRRAALYNLRLRSPDIFRIISPALAADTDSEVAELTKRLSTP